MGNHRTDTAAPTLGERLRRSSDRLWTPLSVSVGMICATVVFLAVLAACLIGPRYGVSVETVLDTLWKVGTAFAGIALAAYARGQRQQMSRIEIGVNKPTE